MRSKQIMKRRGFTLIELLVVISIIALLMAILLPILRRAKGAAMIAFCLSNTHNLSVAWFMYTLENGGLLVGAMNGTSDNSEPRGRKYWYSWVTAPQNEAGISVDYDDASTEDKLRGIERGLLFPYVKNVKVYHCPADPRYKRPPPSGAKSSAFRSYSIAGGMNGTLWVAATKKLYHPCTVYAQIKAPAEKYVFVEDNDPRCFNVHCWEIELTRPRWADAPATWHYNKSNLGFADGHAETHRWMDKSTIEIGQAKTEDEIARLINVDRPDGRDIAYMQKHYAAVPGRETD